MALLVPGMRENGGGVVVISMGACSPLAYESVYSGTKGEFGRRFY